VPDAEPSTLVKEKLGKLVDFSYDSTPRNRYGWVHKVSRFEGFVYD
jgi:hypothetical protein